MLEMSTSHVGSLMFGGPVRDVDAPHLQSFLSHSFPVLRSLEVTMDSRAHACAVGGGCSSLEWLHLTRASLPWTPSVLAQLKDLSLTDCYLSTPALPFLDFLNVLEYEQHLQYLYLRGFLSAVLEPETSAPHERVVTLYGLKHLEISDVPANVARLMTHLHTPAISRVELRGDCSHGVPSTAQVSLLPQDLDTRFPGLQAITRVYLDVSDDENILCFSNPTGTSFELELVKTDIIGWDGSDWFKRGLLQLPALFGSALTELQVGGPLDISPTMWDHVFDSFPALQKLVAKQYNVHNDLPLTMLRSLAAAPACSVPHGVDYPGASTGRAARVRSPALKHLRIDHWTWSRRAMRQILECLRVRAAHGAERLEYFSANADNWDWEPATILAVDKYRAQFLVVVDNIVLDGWFY
ncbi:hypothetical protein TRAPUB_9941 [Trametes pubescens]|uniref:F-box domain-containing protein n=1 Tax=Trametes pubescens TaxID=154538 RepID=A0A1M2W0X2_TRAPU|nr:hypothetical protein TRAPUB_9941 [Trametes pubescens]